MISEKTARGIQVVSKSRGTNFLRETSLKTKATVSASEFIRFAILDLLERPFLSFLCLFIHIDIFLLILYYEQFNKTLSQVKNLFFISCLFQDTRVDHLIFILRFIAFINFFNAARAKMAMHFCSNIDFLIQLDKLLIIPLFNILHTSCSFR